MQKTLLLHANCVCLLLVEIPNDWCVSFTAKAIEPTRLLAQWKVVPEVTGHHDYFIGVDGNGEGSTAMGAFGNPQKIYYLSPNTQYILMLKIDGSDRPYWTYATTLSLRKFSIQYNHVGVNYCNLTKVLTMSVKSF